MTDIKANDELKRNNISTDMDETQDTNRVTFTKKATVQTIDLAEQEEYWKEKYKTRAYYNEGREYEDYATAFHYGWEIAAKPENAGRSFEEIEPELEKDWPTYSESNQNAWRDVKDAIRDAYDRIRGPK